MASNPKSKRSLSEQLEDLDYCIVACLEHVTDPTAFLQMAQAVHAMVTPILSDLTNDLQSYKVELPLAIDEHRGVLWLKESEKYQAYAEDFKNHNLTGETFPTVVSALEELSRVLLAVKQSFQKFKESDLFADYCEREFYYFKDYNWIRRQDLLLDEISEDFTSDDALPYFGEKLQDYMGRLAEVAPKAIDIEKKVIYFEALGHKIWAQSHKQKDAVPIEDTLTLVAACEYFGNLAETPITFLPKKINPNQQNEQTDGLTREQRFTEQRRQKVLLIRNVRMNNYVATICMTKEHFGEKMSVEWVNKLFDDMLSDETLLNAICEKFTEYKRLNSLCRIIGEIWNAKLYADGTSAQNLADCIKVRKPDRNTRSRYVRDRFTKDDPLGVWIRNYLNV